MNFYRLGMPGLHVPGYAAIQKLRDGRRVRTAVYRHVYHSVRPALYLGNDGVRLGVQRALVAHGLALPGKGLRVLFQHTVVDLVYLDRASVVVCGRKQAAAPQVQVRAGQPPSVVMRPAQRVSSSLFPQPISTRSLYARAGFGRSCSPHKTASGLQFL